VLACFISLETLIGALIASRILVQFAGQIFAVILLRRRRPDMPRPYRMWLYPVPCIIALAGWLFIFVTSEPEILLLSVGSLVLGIVAFLAWSSRARRWPFATHEQA